MFSGIDNPQVGEVQALKGLTYRLGCFRGFTEFAFNSIPPAVMKEKEINLSTGMGGPEKRLRRFTSICDSRSKKVVVFSFENMRASVVFPHCLGPTSAVIGERFTDEKRVFESTGITPLTDTWPVWYDNRRCCSRFVLG